MAAGVYEMEDLLPVPLGLSIDAADLAHDVTLGVLFSRGRPLVIEDVHRGCLHTNQEGRGVMGISSYLSPNSMLLMGQGDTLSRFKNWFDAVSPERTTLRKNKELWPPLHTPIMWERNISNRAAAMMHTIGGGFVPPQPPVWSMVTGRASYNDYNSREILGRWIDHPQRLWEVVYIALSSGVETIIHVGPEPNLIPATFKRMSDNVEVQTRGSLGMRALSTAVRRPWLKRVLPARTALLRAPLIEQVMLEDWLLENAPE